MTGATKYSGKVIASDIGGTRREINRMKGGSRRGTMMAKMAASSKRCKHWGHNDVSCRAMLQFLPKVPFFYLVKVRRICLGDRMRLRSQVAALKQCAPMINLTSINRKGEVSLSFDE
jgi:hypothetical protein